MNCNHKGAHIWWPHEISKSCPGRNDMAWTPAFATWPQQQHEIAVEQNANEAVAWYFSVALSRCGVRISTSDKHYCKEKFVGAEIIRMFLIIVNMKNINKLKNVIIYKFLCQ